MLDTYLEGMERKGMRQILYIQYPTTTPGLRNIYEMRNNQFTSTAVMINLTYYNIFFAASHKDENCALLQKLNMVNITS